MIAEAKQFTPVRESAREVRAGFRSMRRIGWVPLEDGTVRMTLDGDAAGVAPSEHRAKELAAAWRRLGVGV